MIQNLISSFSWKSYAFMIGLILPLSVILSQSNIIPETFNIADLIKNQDFPFSNQLSKTLYLNKNELSLLFLSLLLWSMIDRLYGRGISIFSLIVTLIAVTGLFYEPLKIISNYNVISQIKQYHDILKVLPDVALYQAVIVFLSLLIFAKIALRTKTVNQRSSQPKRGSKKSNKARMTPSEIGKAYEGFIGHVFEKKGYKVIYHGFEMGGADQGVDLIAYNRKETVFIQCKNIGKNSGFKISYNDMFAIVGKMEFFKTNGDWSRKYSIKKSNPVRLVFAVPAKHSFDPKNGFKALEYAESKNLEILQKPHL